MQTLTREQALEEYVQIKRQIEDLKTKEKNLRAVILMQQIAPQRRAVGRPRGKGGINQNEKTILAFINGSADGVSAPYIFERCNINKDTVYTVLGRLASKGIVNRRKVGSAVLYSMAVHQEQSNGLAQGGLTA